MRLNQAIFVLLHFALFPLLELYSVCVFFVLFGLSVSVN